MRDYQKEYESEKDRVVRVSMKLSYSSDADIIDWLSLQKSKQGALKRAVRAEINKTK